MLWHGWELHCDYSPSSGKPLSPFARVPADGRESSQRGPCHNCGSADCCDFSVGVVVPCVRASNVAFF